MRLHRIYRPVWSQAILDELAYTLTRLLTLKGRATDEVNAYVTRLRNQMGNAFPDALTTGWDHLLPTITIPDPDDTHVVAARTGRHGPAHSPQDLVEHLSKTGTPAFAATVLDQLTRSG